jgi:hypothetical protein
MTICDDREVQRGFRRRAVEYGLSAPDIAPKTPEKGSDE